jgi:hypothetical protein
MNQHPTTMSFNVRIPRQMHAQLKALAAQEDRTLNGEITYLLRLILASYHPAQRASDAPREGSTAGQ